MTTELAEKLAVLLQGGDGGFLVGLPYLYYYKLMMKIKT
jgi:hypothetical protein